MKSNIYKKKGNEYLGDSTSRPFCDDIGGHTHLYNRFDTALYLEGLNESNTTFKDMSNWIEDMNYTNENLQFTNEEMLTVLAIFDYKIGAAMAIRILKGR